MKKNKEKKIVLSCSKRKIIKLVLKLFEHPKKIMILNYNGKRGNTIYGLDEEFSKVKVPLRFVFIYLIKKFIQQPIFKILINLDGSEFKNKMYRKFGMKIGKDVYISPGVYIDDVFPEFISIGNGSIIGRGVNILAHEFTIKHARFGLVKIGKQVTIGAHSIVRSGVNIENQSVIAMDSLVNKDVPSREEWAGIPAKKIKSLKKVL